VSGIKDWRAAGDEVGGGFVSLEKEKNEEEIG
jgi:hypothetical protein